MSLPSPSSKKIKQVLQTDLKSALDHQSWLNDLIATANTMNIPIRWRNPLGTPLALRDFNLVNTRQKLVKTKPWCLFKDVIDVNNQDHLAIWSNLTKFDQPTNHLKNLAGFPPNYVHSLDAVHLKLANYDYRNAKKEELGANEFGEEPPERSWISIHDSFGSTAAYIDDFNKYIRNAFVEIYSYNQPSDDIRQQLILDFIYSATDQRTRMFDLADKLVKFGVMDGEQSNKIKENLASEYDRVIKKFNTLPETGDFDIEKVKESTYFFS